MTIKTESTMTATFADKAEAVQYVTKALIGAKVIRVWFSDHFWDVAERYEVIVVTSDLQQDGQQDPNTSVGLNRAFNELRA